MEIDKINEMLKNIQENNKKLYELVDDLGEYGSEENNIDIQYRLDDIQECVEHLEKQIDKRMDKRLE